MFGHPPLKDINVVFYHRQIPEYDEYKFFILCLIKKIENSTNPPGVSHAAPQ